jgi:hypothetical protein
MFQVTDVTLPAGAVVLALVTGEGWPEPPAFTAYTWKSYDVDATNPVADTVVLVIPVA